MRSMNARYGKDTDPGVREKVAKALANQGFVLGRLDHSEEALQVLKQVDERYGKDTDPRVREPIAQALVNQGVVFGKMGCFEEAIGILNRWMNAMVKIQTPALGSR